jgi:hypothetical protein
MTARWRTCFGAAERRKLTRRILHGETNRAAGNDGGGPEEWLRPPMRGSASTVGSRRRSPRWQMDRGAVGGYWRRGGPHGPGKQSAPASVLGVFSRRKLLGMWPARRSEVVQPGSGLQWLADTAATWRGVAGEE